MPKMLVVDDEIRIRELIKEYAEFNGFEVTQAEDGMDAVAKVREQDFDIIGDASDAAVDNDLGMQECGADIVVGMDDPDLPPR